MTMNEEWNLTPKKGYSDCYYLCIQKILDLLPDDAQLDRYIRKVAKENIQLYIKFPTERCDDYVLL